MKVLTHKGCSVTKASAARTCHPQPTKITAGILPSKPVQHNAPFKSAGLTPCPHASRTVPRASYADQPTLRSLTAESSPLVNREVVLFLFQLEMDAQIQRALTYEDFDTVQDLRTRRNKIDATLAELSKLKGHACGARCASHSDQFEHATETITIQARMQDAVATENFALAAQLRDRLRAIEAATQQQSQESTVLALASEPRFALGEMVVHTAKGYRGVVCGWDLACCETMDWQSATGASRLQRGTKQVFYHVLVDTSDWPGDEEQPPVAYVAEELLDAASLANFESLEPLADYAFAHPYSYYMFLGSDGHGNMLPCGQLRAKYNVQRADVYPPWHESESDSEGEGDEGGDGAGGSWGGGPTIPGIDMRSLD